MKARTRDDSGAILVWVAVMMIAFLAIAAIAVDLGYGYAVKRKLSATADSAALAGAQEAGLKFLTPSVKGCGLGLTGVVTAAAHDNYRANAPQGSQGNPPVTVTCYDANGAVMTTGTDAAKVEVKVDTSATLNTFFGRVLGVATLNPAATATAAVEGNRNLNGLRPFLVCVTDAQDARSYATNPQGDDPRPFQSFYAKFDQKVPLPGAPIVNNATWDPATGVIDVGAQHTLSINDYVLLDVNVTGGARYYYVENTSNKTFTVALTYGGQLVTPPESQVVDIYTPPAPVLTGALWAATTGVIAQPATTPLLNGTEVQVALGNNNQATTLEGRYTVAEANSATFQLSDGGNVAPASGATVDVRLWSIPGGSGACNPGTSPANWGYSAFDLKTGQNNQLDCLIEFGYGGGPQCLDRYLSVPGVNVGGELAGTPAEGDQGNNLQPNSQNLIKALIDSKDPILLPVGNNWVDSGNNANYDGRGALSVQLCGYAFPGSKPLTTTNKYFPAGSGYCGSNQKYIDAVSSLKVTKDTSLVIQWQYADWVPGYQGAPSNAASKCTLDQGCGQVRLIK